MGPQVSPRTERAARAQFLHLYFAEDSPTRPNATLAEIGQLDAGSELSLGISAWGSTRCPSVCSQLSVSEVSCSGQIDVAPLGLEDVLDILFSSGLLPLRETSLCAHLVC